MIPGHPRAINKNHSWNSWYILCTQTKAFVTKVLGILPYIKTINLLEEHVHIFHGENQTLASRIRGIVRE